MNTRSQLPNKRRSRRLRKKLHIGEFKAKGFEISFRFEPGLTQEHQLDVLQKFVAEAIEPRRLLFGGGAQGFVTKAGRASTSEADRSAISAWLESCPQIQDVRVGPNEDAWYGCGDGKT